MLKFSNYRLALIFVVASLGFHSASPTNISHGESNIIEVVPIDAATQASECRLPHYVSIKSRYYYFGFDLNLSQPDASKHCQKLNMELVSIEDCEEHNYLTNMLKDHGSDCYSKLYWTSGYLNNSNFYWGTGAPFIYRNWQSGEPNNKHGNENCVNIKSNFLQWNDDVCEFLHSFICESANNPKKNN